MNYLRLSVGLAIWSLALSANVPGATFDPTKVSDDQIRLVAQRLHREVSQCGASAESQKELAASLDGQVKALLASQCRGKTDALYGAFAEVKPNSEKDIDFARRYFDPICTLARAYSLPASAYYHSAEVADAIRLGLVYTRKHVYPNGPRPGNWWVWNKKMPSSLCDLLALVSDDLQADDRAYLVSVLDYLIGTGPIPGSGYHTGKAGKDALNALKVGVLTGDRQRIAHAWECMENEVGPYLLEPDGTPLTTVIKEEFLGISLPYIYEGYQTPLTWARLTQGTHMALRPETMGKLADYLLGLGRWNTFEGTEVAWLSFTSYRVFWQPATTLTMAGELAATGAPRADELRAMAAGRDKTPDGCRFWPTAETVIFRGPGYYTAVVMASQPRHKISWAYKNRFLNIGNKWYYGRDGHLVLARRPAEADVNLTYTLDWRRLTGVTHDDGSVLRSDQIVEEDHGYWQPAYAVCRNPLAGAATLNGRDGVAGIELQNGAIRARKSYFFLRDKNMIVTLGSHICGEGPTESIVHTVPVDDSQPTILVNGKTLTLTEAKRTEVAMPCWVYAAGGGYYFSETGRVTVLVETRMPDFTDARPPQQSDVPAQTFVSLFFEHGKDPKNASYACAYFPIARAAEMPALVEAFDSQAAIGRSEVGHGFRYGDLTGMVFFRPGTMDGYSADRPCVVALRTSATAIRLSLYEPTWKDCRLRLVLPFEAAGAQLPEGCRWDGPALITDLKAGEPREFDLRP